MHQRLNYADSGRYMAVSAVSYSEHDASVPPPACASCAPAATMAVCRSRASAPRLTAPPTPSVAAWTTSAGSSRRSPA